MNPEVDPGGTLSHEVLNFLRDTTGHACTVAEIAGDASTRRFYRVSAGGGVRPPGISGSEPTYILMAHGERLAPDAGLFSNHRILEGIGAPVPRLIGRSDSLGLVLVEDFGDLSLQKAAAGATPEQLRGLYRQAGALIVLMQTEGARALRPDDFAFRNALDRERFLFELNHFDRHFVRGLRHHAPSEQECAELLRFYGDLAGACDRMPRVYCHRDFQSRNLMVSQGRLRLIDFQDARMGPYVYDAASLLRDSSLDLPADLVAEMLKALAATCGTPLAVGAEEFERDFSLMALQRNIKDLGTFGYMATVRGRSDYLDYVPRTERYIRAAMLADRRHHDIYAIFDRLLLG